YSRGMRPSTDHVANRRPPITRRQFNATVIRTIGYTATAPACSFLVHHVDHAWSFALRVGLATGIVTWTCAAIVAVLVGAVRCSPHLIESSHPSKSAKGGASAEAFLRCFRCLRAHLIHEFAHGSEVAR